MNQLAPITTSPNLPALIAASGERASLRFLEFFAANIRNPHTRRAYSRAVSEFMTCCEDNRVTSITAMQPLHVSAWIEQQTRACGPDRQAAPGGAAPSVRLAGVGPGDAGEPGRIGARTFSRREIRQDAGAGTEGSARADRCHRHHNAGRIA
jgi:hypothetical protein